MIGIDLANARRLVRNVVLGQALVTLLAVLLSYLLADARAALSAGLGGGISTLASLVMGVMLLSSSSADPQRAVRAFYAGEAAKIAVVVVLFVVVLKTVRVNALAMLGAYIATFVVFWLALANALPTPAGRATGNVHSRQPGR
ncbi:MAG: ATP synthase subunit I [Steroidobacteraceae bacterium]